MQVAMGRDIQDDGEAGRLPALWSAEAARRHLAGRLAEARAAALQAGVRPRLVIFDYLEQPVAGPLRSIAQDLDLLVGVEPISFTTPGPVLRDRFRLLEKSKGIHGVLFPAGLTLSHRECLEAHPNLGQLALDRRDDSFSPQVLSFLQLAALNRWNPEGRRACILCSRATHTIASGLCSELESLKMTVTMVWEREQIYPALNRSSLLWLCHGQPLGHALTHLASDTVLVDSGRAFDLPSSLSEAQIRLLPHRIRGLCPAGEGLWPLLNLNRVLRLLQRAIGIRRSRSAAAGHHRGRVGFTR
jgi:hypothetical protein